VKQKLNKTWKALKYGFFVLAQLWAAFFTVSDSIAHHSSKFTPTIFILLWLIWWLVLLNETDWQKERIRKAKNADGARSS